MRPYEVMIIFDPTLDDETVRAEVDRSTELIRSRGGQPGRVERWGKRRLAYEIRRHREGSYVVLEAQAEPATMADLAPTTGPLPASRRPRRPHPPLSPPGRPPKPNN
jgi:small subunit ribosomal protein S6